MSLLGRMQVDDSIDKNAPCEREHVVARLAEQGKFDEAISLLDAAIAQNESADLWNDWATMHYACGNINDAERGYRKALTLKSSDRQAGVNLGLMLFAQGRLQEGIPLLERHKDTLTVEEKTAIRTLSLRFQSNSDTRNETPAFPTSSRESVPPSVSPTTPQRRITEHLPRTSKNLVVLRAGDKSLHEAWMYGPNTRNWDLVISYYDSDRDRFRRDDVVRIDGLGPTKWPALYNLASQLRSEILEYDYVWFPDDDLATDMQTINRLFALCTELKLQLAQPALSLDSYVSYPGTFANSSFVVRYTNFVEIMAPVFSRAFLARCVDSFAENISGYGLDSLWPSWITDPRGIAIIDACVVKHTRPVGGPIYQAVAAAGKSPAQELTALLSNYGIQQRRPITSGGIDRSGRELLLSEGQGPELAELLLKGYLPALANQSEALVELLRPILRYAEGRQQLV